MQVARRNPFLGVDFNLFEYATKGDVLMVQLLLDSTEFSVEVKAEAMCAAAKWGYLDIMHELGAGDINVLLRAYELAVQYNMIDPILVETKIQKHISNSCLDWENTLK